MCDKEVYLGLGGNIGATADVLQQACSRIAGLDGVFEFKVSRFYQTTPVSDIPQADYINAVCCFATNLQVCVLWRLLQEIEISLGKREKPKNAPRVIDIDILLFNSASYNQHGLQIPHPRWQERLFVLVPMRELTATVRVPEKTDGKNERIVEIELDILIEQLSSLHEEMEKQCIKCL